MDYPASLIMYLICPESHGAVIVWGVEHTCPEPSMQRPDPVAGNQESHWEDADSKSFYLLWIFILNF